jgi:putative flippase GtrA
MTLAPSAALRPRSTFARFSAVSLTSTAVTLVVIAVLSDENRLSNAQAAAAATAIGFVCSYTMSRRWAFAGGVKSGHLVSLLWLGGLSIAGLLLSGAAGAGVDALAASAHLGRVTTLVAEETVESIVLAALFVVRFTLSRALFGLGRWRCPALEAAAPQPADEPEDWAPGDDVAARRRRLPIVAASGPAARRAETTVAAARPPTVSTAKPTNESGSPGSRSPPMCLPISKMIMGWRM